MERAEIISQILAILEDTHIAHVNVHNFGNSAFADPTHAPGRHIGLRTMAMPGRHRISTVDLCGYHILS